MILWGWNDPTHIQCPWLPTKYYLLLSLITINTVNILSMHMYKHVSGIELRIFCPIGSYLCPYISNFLSIFNTKLYVLIWFWLFKSAKQSKATFVCRTLSQFGVNNIRCENVPLAWLETVFSHSKNLSPSVEMSKTQKKKSLT